MDTGASVESLLRQIALLLGKHGEATWAESLERWAGLREGRIEWRLDEGTGR